MPDAPQDAADRSASPTATLARELLDLTAGLGARAAEDPFGNPVLLVSLAISRQLDTGTLTTADIAALIRHLRDAAFADRAEGIGRYLGGIDTAANDAILAQLAQHLLRPDPNDSPVRWAEYRAMTERTRFAAVFTAHPTFSLPTPVSQALAGAACGRPAPDFESHRPPPITLRAEFDQAVFAIANGRDAIDRFNAALISVGRTAWPDRWTDLAPRPVVLSSWVGYDTDGRTDIGWWDTLRLRLEMKHLQLVRLHAQTSGISSASDLAAHIGSARDMVARQIEACPAHPDPAAVAVFARGLIGCKDTALSSPAPLLPLFQDAIAAAGDHAKLMLTVAKAGLLSHGLALAHTHTRLNAAQVHNVVRQRLGFADSPEDPSRRRALFAKINAALDTVQPEAVDFGALIAEQASAARLMMTVGQTSSTSTVQSPCAF
ncbi:MAG TPA: hypothetical protein VFG62_14915 [Rhodopila sp.]|nr:hypothetical protein [Rhodopila sp.]